MLSNNISNILNISNSKFILKIDEQSRIIFNNENSNSLNNYLNFPYPKLHSLQQLREKNIIFETDDKHMSNECPGVMMSDILANAVDRIYNEDRLEIYNFINNHGNIDIQENIFIWPLNKRYKLIELFKK